MQVDPFKGLSIKHKLWIPIGVQLLVLLLIGVFYLRSNALMDDQQANSAATADLATAVREVSSQVQAYLHRETNQASVLAQLERARSAAGATAQGEGFRERLNRVEGLIARIQAGFDDGAAIREEIFALTQSSIEQSDSFIRQTSERLAHPTQRSAVSDLERLVIQGAATNTSGNLMIQQLFTAVEADRSRGGELLRFLELGIDNAAADARRLAGTPFQGMALTAGEANRQIRELVGRQLENLEQRDHLSAQAFAITTELLEAIRELEAKQQQAVFSAFGSSLALLLIVMLVATVLAAAFFMNLAGTISRPLKRMADAMEELAASGGDLTFRLNVDRRDEIGALASGFDHFMAKLQEIFAQIAELVRAVDASAGQAAHSSTQVRDNAHEQKEQTTQVATAVTEMESTIQEVARSAGDAATNAGDADRNVRLALQVLDSNIAGIEALSLQISRTQERVTQLEGDSENIGGILDVIRGVAEQTNLLALNAAIEAARAGEQGRGFAVVADEVRQLASRTQEATQQIQDMIEGLQRASRETAAAMQAGSAQTQDCVELARQAGQRLNDSAGAISEISDQNAQIASAVEEQSAVAQEIGRNIHLIAGAADRTVQEGSGAAQVAGELAGQAERLAGIVRQFKV